ncbi:MFS transporter [Streptomyces sp. NPDC047061]|uniref:MFS transporter n=1 Tax=Streptomyces sp. NPDC047061 TaxID=3154605 RepID=UPI00341103E7
MHPTHPSALDTKDAAQPRLNVLVVVLTFAGIAVAFTQSMVFPIVPLLPGLLSAGSADTAWAVTATLLSGAVATPVMGRLADMYGKRRMVLLGIVVLAAGSVLCALSESLAPFLVGRTLQGLAAPVVPLGISIMRDLLPAERVPGATSLMSGSLGVGGAVGLPISALIVDNFDWHVLFWAAAAFGVVAGVFVVLLVPESTVRAGGRFDLTGALGLAVGLVCMLLAVSKGEDWGWGSGNTLGLFGGAAVVLTWWGWFQLRSSQPLVNLRTAARPQVLFTNLVALAIGFSLFVMSLVLPQLLQTPESTGYGLGKSLVVVGLVMAPSGLVMLATTPLSSRLTREKGPKTTLMVGSVITGAGYLLAMAMMSEVWQLIVASCVVAVGVSFALGALPGLIMGAVPVSETAAGNSLNALMRSIGNTVSSAAAGVILAHMTVAFGDAVLPSENGLRAVLAIGVGSAALALAVACFIPRQKPADLLEEVSAPTEKVARRPVADAE